MIDRVATMLNSFLAHLVGEKHNHFKVLIGPFRSHSAGKRFAKIRLFPARTSPHHHWSLSELCRPNEGFCESCRTVSFSTFFRIIVQPLRPHFTSFSCLTASESRSYNIQIFEEALSIVNKLGIINPSQRQKFRALIDNLQACSLERVEEEIPEDEIPEEFKVCFLNRFVQQLLRFVTVRIPSLVNSSKTPLCCRPVVILWIDLGYCAIYVLTRKPIPSIVNRSRRMISLKQLNWNVCGAVLVCC